MKKFFYLMMAAFTLVFAACSDDEEGGSTQNLPQLNFAAARYVLADDSVDIVLKADQAPASTVEIPVTFSGATEGQDFTASSTSFVLEAGMTEATIRLTRIVENIADEEKTLTINLGTVPAGYRAGTMSYTTVQLMGNNSVFMSFEKATDVLTENGNYTISLKTLEGSRYKVPAATTFEVIVDETSTAVEGTHFEFPNGKTITLDANDYEGKIAVKCLKKEEGKDKLVLRLAEKSGYAFGSNQTITIELFGRYNVSGTWAFKEISNLTWFEEYWFTDTSNFPTGTSDDLITFVGDETGSSYTFTPDLQGDLKNFFVAPCQVTYKGEAEKGYQEESGTQLVSHVVALLEFEQVNVNFSATHSNVRPSQLGFRLITVDSEEILECTIDDFEPTDFLADEYDLMGEMSLCPLRLYFTRMN